jgi:hypothetical protein
MPPLSHEVVHGSLFFNECPVIMAEIANLRLLYYMAIHPGTKLSLAVNSDKVREGISNKARTGHV